jgi:O-antigen ligase
LRNSLNNLIFYGLLLLLAGAAIPYGASEPWWQSAFQSAVFLLTAIAIAVRLRASTSLRLDLKLVFPVLTLLVYASAQSVAVLGINNGNSLSADFFHTRQFAKQIAALLCLGLLVRSLASSERRLRRLVWFIISIAVASALFGLIRQAFQTNPGFLLPRVMPAYGYAQFINSNHFAYLMEMALGLIAGLIICRQVKGKLLILSLAAALVMFAALVLSNSRGGILSLLCQVLLLAMLLANQISKRRKGRVSRARQTGMGVALALMLLIGSVVTVVFVGGDPLSGRVRQVAVELNPETATSYTLRRSIWSATLSLIKEHPIAGVGFGGYWIAITKYHQASGEATPQEAHNDYLELLASGGIIGVGIFIWLVWAIIADARRVWATGDEYDRAVRLGAIAGIAGVLVHSLVDFGLHVPINAMVFTVLIALVLRKGDLGT